MITDTNKTKIKVKMKKIIIALMCATVSVASMAQPQRENQKSEKPMCCQEIKPCCQDMCCGIDSTTMKTVMELKKKYRENYRKELRQTLGDEKYIQYLEYQVDKKHRKAMRKAMKHRKGQWGQPNPRRMVRPGFPGPGPKFQSGMKKDDFKGNKDTDKKNKDKKKDNKKKDNK